jgi:NAD(P)-dependent dehydrogenase (short-subunit alcohol dehydrogenase family)
MSSPVILILGAGANIGKSVAQRFAKNGYKVALVGRKLASHTDSTKELQIKADFTNPASIKTVFDEVTSKLGVPNVVVYNGREFHQDLEVSILKSYKSNLTSIKLLQQPTPQPIFSLHRQRALPRIWL